MNTRPTGIYQVYDNTAQSTTGPIFTAYHKAAAIRIFTDALKDTRSALNAHMKDYDLLYLGEQDESTGNIFGDEQPEIILKGQTYAEMITDTNKAEGNAL